MRKAGYMKRAIIASIFLVLTCSTSQAALYISMDNWTLDVSALFGGGGSIGGQNQYRLTGLGQLTFLAVGRTFVNDTNGDMLLAPGETFQTFTGGRISDLISGGGTSVKPLVYGLDGTLSGFDGWQLSFEFQAPGLFGGDT